MSPRLLYSTPAAQAAGLFHDAFGGPPLSAASAPGRVNLIGEHTDYNGGPVLPLALQRRTAIACAPATDWSFVSATDNTPERRDPDAPMTGRWSDYLVGVVRELAAQNAAPSGAHVAVSTNVPIGAGLSSSAALTVAAAKALSQLAGRRLTPPALADIAYRAEHDQVGVRCGRMDQTIAAHARTATALFFDTATGALREVPFRGKLWVVETGMSHKLTGGELNARRHECEEALARCRERWPTLPSLAMLPAAELPAVERMLPPPLARRVRHVVTETARTRAAAEALAAEDLDTLGRLLLEGHASLRDDYQSTVPEADLVVAAAAAAGAYGARLTGAGWGGAVLVLASKEAEARVLAEVSRAFAASFGRSPAVWSTRAGSGVRREPTRI
jgi:galactokinase